MPTGLLLMLDAPQRFKATYCHGEIYVAESRAECGEPDRASKAGVCADQPSPCSFLMYARASLARKPSG